MDIIEKILDDNNSDDIAITNEETGEEVVFEQIATIPYNDIVYSILSPRESNDVFTKGEGIVFKIVQEDDDTILTIEEDDDIVDKIYDIYDEMYKETYGNFVYEEEDK